MVGVLDTGVAVHAGDGRSTPRRAAPRGGRSATRSARASSNCNSAELADQGARRLRSPGTGTARTCGWSSKNGQLTQGGSLHQFVGLFDGLQREGHANVARHNVSTSATGRGAAVSALDAAAALAPYVEYVHCKIAAGEGARRFAAAPAIDEARFAAVLDRLPRRVPRGIEFPLDPACIDDDATRRVA